MSSGSSRTNAGTLGFDLLGHLPSETWPLFRVATDAKGARSDHTARPGALITAHTHRLAWCGEALVIGQSLSLPPLSTHATTVLTICRTDGRRMW